jgi:hypothetical protein
VAIVYELVLVTPMPAVCPLLPFVVNAFAGVANDVSVKDSPAWGAHPTAAADSAAVVAMLIVMLVAVPAAVATVPLAMPGLRPELRNAPAGTPVKFPLSVVELAAALTGDI